MISHYFILFDILHPFRIQRHLTKSSHALPFLLRQYAHTHTLTHHLTTISTHTHTHTHPPSPLPPSLSSFLPTYTHAHYYFNTHTQHTQGDVHSVCFHPEGRHLASGGHDRTVAIHDVIAATCLKQFSGHDAGVTHVTYNRYGVWCGVV